MGNFTENFTKTYNFDGDDIHVTMKRLTREGALILAPHVNVASNGDIKMSFKDQLDFMGSAGDVVADCVLGVRGMRVDGIEVDLDRFKDLVSNQVYFIKLLGEMVSDLMSESFPQKDDEGNSEKPAEDTSVG